MSGPLLYFSGNVGSLAREKRIQARAGITHRCLSYAYMGPLRRDQVDIFEWCVGSGVKVFLDSGAFTLQNDKGCNLATAHAYMGKYLAFVREYLPKLDAFVTVDWRRDGAVVQESLQWFKDRGVGVMPVYHGETDMANLRRICDEGYKWVGVSKADSATQFTLHRFYSRVFEIADSYQVSIHGLSETSLNMLRYPFYSVDSTTWLQDSGRGLIIQPDLVRKKIRRIYISDDRRNGRFPHWSQFSPEGRAKVRKQMEAWGFDENGIKSDHLERTAFNARVFIEMLKVEHNMATVRWESLLSEV